MIIQSDLVEKYLSLLAETPWRIAACASRLDEARLRWSPGKRGWSAVEVLAHVRACHDMWSHSIYAMLAHDNPSLPWLDERRWAEVMRYAALGFHPSFQAFVLGREELLRVLRDLPVAAWSRTARIEGYSHSVFSQARRLALHEIRHCDGIESLLKLESEAGG